MSTTTLSDVIVPEVYQGYMTINTPELTAFWGSGIVSRSPMLDAAARGPSNIVQVPFWKDLDATKEPNISTDNPANKSVPNKIEAGKQVGMNAYLNQSWSAMSLVKELAGSDPMGAIVGATNRYWSRQWQRRLISSCVGIFSCNVADNDGDMVYDISKADAGIPGDANKFGGQAFVRSLVTMGDALGAIQAIAVHSTIYGRMLENDQIEFVVPSGGTTRIPTYKDKIVIVDDGMPVEVDANDNTIFTSILYGAGEDVLHERRTWLLHPTGFAFDPQAVAGQSATLTELEQAAAWTRVIERKNVPMAFLRTNG